MHFQTNRQHRRTRTWGIVAPRMNLGDGQFAACEKAHQRQHEVIAFQRHSLHMIRRCRRLLIARLGIADGNVAACSLAETLQRGANLIGRVPVPFHQEQGAEAVPEPRHARVANVSSGFADNLAKLPRGCFFQGAQSRDCQ